MNSKTVVKVREQLGLTKEEFAKKVGVQVSTVWRWETGRSKPRPGVSSAIKALGRLPTLQSILVNQTTEPMTVVSGHQRVEAVQAADDTIVERTNGNEAEKALLAATSEITAAWIAGHKCGVPAGDTLTFVHQLTRALRKE
jgi:transcriptional regulator with XRE-family HTH domain